VQHVADLVQVVDIDRGAAQVAGDLGDVSDVGPRAHRRRPVDAVTNIGVI
jgi:hypothetical protein